MIEFYDGGTVEEIDVKIGCVIVRASEIRGGIIRKRKEKIKRRETGQTGDIISNLFFTWPTLFTTPVDIYWILLNFHLTVKIDESKIWGIVILQQLQCNCFPTKIDNLFIFFFFSHFDFKVL